MTTWTTKYLPYIEEFKTNPAVAEFATTLYNRAQQLFAEEITIREFDDNIYLEVLESDSKDLKFAKNSLNYMKDRIAACS